MRLSVPSVVFAEATWYGSLRGGLEVGGGKDAEFFDGVSRWGVKGSVEASEGLTAVYRFESKLTTTDGSQPGGRLAYAGLSGGFGSISVGQIWNAAYNHAGAITDKSWYFGDSTTGYRHGNALSYAFSSGPVSFQLGLISDGKMNTGQGIDKTEFGMTVALGEMGKIALAHTNVRDNMVKNMTDRIPGTPYVPEKIITEERPGTPAVDAVPEMYYVTVGTGDAAMEHQVHKIDVHLLPAENIAANVVDGAFTTAGLALITRSGTDGRYHFNGADAAACKLLVDADDGDADDCDMVTAYVRTVTNTGAITRPAGNEGTEVTATAPSTVNQTFYAKPARTTDPVMAQPAGEPTPAVKTPAVPGTEETPPMEFTETHPGHKNTHFAVEFNVGGMTPYVGYSVKKDNMGMKLQDKNKDKMLTEDEFLVVAAKETKTTHYGVSGGLGDTGISFLVAARSEKPAGGEKTSPWLVNVWKDLGGGATVIFGHGKADDGKSGTSRVGLHVSF